MTLGEDKTHSPKTHKNSRKQYFQLSVFLRGSVLATRLGASDIQQVASGLECFFNVHGSFASPSFQKIQMRIQQSAPAVVPKVLSSELLSVPKHVDNTPGLILSTHDLLAHSPSFAQGVDGLWPARGLTGSPTLVISPQETSCLFAHSGELDLLKSVAGLIAQQIHPRLKTAVDALWLIYKSARLKEEWDRPDRDTVTCLFKMGGLALGCANLAGGVYPDLKLSDPWSNGFNFLLKSGESILQGKTVPVNELIFSTDKRFDIPLKALKLAGISLDAQTTAENSTLGAPTLPRITPLTAS